MPYFVFIEFGNEAVTDFLSKLRSSLDPTPKKSSMHVTLRGPYVRSPRAEALEDYAERLRGYGVKIHNYGSFKTRSGYAVFLRAECSIFRELWDKPDFRVPRTAIQPHITIYEGESRAAAEEIRDFLKREKLQIHTYNLNVSVYESRPIQATMLETPTVSSMRNRINHDIWRVPDGMLERASELGARLARTI